MPSTFRKLVSKLFTTTCCWPSSSSGTHVSGVAPIHFKRPARASNITAATNQFLTFLLGAGQYGVEILKVQEIRGYSAVTPIPNTPAYITGVINLRGTVVPVVDLRAKFSMERAEYSKFTVIIVVTVSCLATR